MQPYDGRNISLPTQTSDQYWHPLPRKLVVSGRGGGGCSCGELRLFFGLSDGLNF